MTNAKLGERFKGHYGLEFVMTNDEKSIQDMLAMLAKRNRMAKQEKKFRITPTWRKILKRELDERMRIRRRKQKQRREHYYK